MYSVSATSMHTQSQTVTPLVSRSVDHVLFKIETSLHQVFSQVVDIMNFCFINALLYNTPNK